MIANSVPFHADSIIYHLLGNHFSTRLAREIHLDAGLGEKSFEFFVDISHFVVRSTFFDSQIWMRNSKDATMLKPGEKSYFKRKFPPMKLCGDSTWSSIYRLPALRIALDTTAKSQLHSLVGESPHCLWKRIAFAAILNFQNCKLIELLLHNTYMIVVIHWQRHTESLFIIFAAATGAADDGVSVVVAIISIGCVCRRQNGVCMSTINVIHIEIQQYERRCRQAQYEFSRANYTILVPYYVLPTLLYVYFILFFFCCLLLLLLLLHSFTLIHTYVQRTAYTPRTYVFIHMDTARNIV